MPHVDLPLDVTKPADGDLLNIGDDAIRKIVRQILEILTDLTVDPTADPLVLKASAVGTASIPDGSITAAKLAASIGLRNGILTSVLVTHSFTSEATYSFNTAYLPASPGQLAFCSWAPASAIEAELLNKFTISACVLSASVLTVAVVNNTNSTVNLNNQQLNILLINPTPVGT